MTDTLEAVLNFTTQLTNEKYELEQQLFEEHEAHLIAEQRWIEKLAECQAREKVLRDALVRYANTWTWNPDYVLAALAQPTDDTALKAALAAERVRCAEAVDDFVNEHTYSRAGNVIRALENE